MSLAHAGGTPFTDQLRAQPLKLLFDRDFNLGKGGIGMRGMPGSKITLDLMDGIGGGGGHGEYLSRTKMLSLYDLRAAPSTSSSKNVRRTLRSCGQSGAVDIHHDPLYPSSTVRGGRGESNRDGLRRRKVGSEILRMREEWERIAPTFIVAGAARSGTSSLYSWLDQHPAVFMSPVKETNYFAQLTGKFTGPGDEAPSAMARDSRGRLKRHHGYAYLTSWEEYLSLFKGAECFMARGEASNAYLYYPGCAERIHRAIPQCKIIIVLRNPADRAISHYRAMVKWGRESLSLDEALAAGTERVRSGWEWSWDFVGAGNYADQVQRFLDSMPGEQVRVWLFEDLERDPVSFYRQVCDFIRVDSTSFLPDFEVRNAAPRVQEVGLQRLRRRMRPVGRAYDRLPWGIKRATRPWLAKALGTRPLTMRPETRAELLEYFHDDIRRLQRLLPDLDVEGQWLMGPNRAESGALDRVGRADPGSAGQIV